VMPGGRWAASIEFPKETEDLSRCPGKVKWFSREKDFVII
jgi:hypothetical protein